MALMKQQLISLSRACLSAISVALIFPYQGATITGCLTSGNQRLLAIGLSTS